MSIANVTFHNALGDVAFVSADTEVWRAGQLVHLNKLFVIPSASAVLVARGEQKLTQWLFAYYLDQPPGLAFDTILATLSETLTGLYDEFARQLKLVNLDAADALYQMELVGYSEERGMVIRVEIERQQASIFRIKITPMGVISPAPAENLRDMDISDPQELHMRVAKIQKLERKALNEGNPIGGQLMFARVTKGEVTVRNLGPI